MVKATISGMKTVGSLAVVTNRTGVVTVDATDADLELLREVLKVELFRVTVNDGSKFVRSGLLANDLGVVVGSRTKGPELMLLSAAFNR